MTKEPVGGNDGNGGPAETRRLQSESDTEQQ